MPAMHNTGLQITASAVISNRGVFRDGGLIYSGSGLAVVDYLTELYNFLAPDYPKFYKMDNLAKLGWLCSELLLRDSFDKTAFAPEDTGIVLSNSNSSLDTDLRYFKTVSEYPSPSLFVYTLPNIVIGEICIRNQFRGENAFFIFEKFNPVFLEQYAGSLVKNNVLKNCICGWVEILGDKFLAVMFLVQKGEGKEFSAGEMEAVVRTAAADRTP